MCSDNYINFAVLQFFKNSLYILRCNVPGKHFHPYRKTVHTGTKCAVVLKSEYGCRHKHRDLLSVHYAFEGRAESDLRFAESHVSAQKSVHGTRFLHIPFYFTHRFELSVCFLIFETAFKFSLPLIIRRKSVSRSAAALGIQCDKLFCHILRRLFGAGFFLNPLASSHF